MFLRPSGVCPCLVRVSGKAACAIHPALVRSEGDLRRGFCDTGYICDTAAAWERWDEERRGHFVAFAKTRATAR